jgi:hypothetical protein
MKPEILSRDTLCSSGWENESSLAAISVGRNYH